LFGENFQTKDFVSANDLFLGLCNVVVAVIVVANNPFTVTVDLG